MTRGANGKKLMENLVHFKWSQHLIEYTTHSKENSRHFVLVSLLRLFLNKNILIDGNFSKVPFETPVSFSLLSFKIFELKGGEQKKKRIKKQMLKLKMTFLFISFSV